MYEIRELTLDALRNEIQKGIDDLENGRFTDGEEVMASFAEKLASLPEDTIHVGASTSTIS